MNPINLKAKEDLGGMVTILEPEDAMQPILPEMVRGAVHQWMTEIRAEDDLKAVNVLPRKSAMLSGPPGCGKTTLAHHLAARLSYNLVCVHMDRLRSQYVGQTGNQIAQLFAYLKKQRDVIAFFDEFDALAMSRTSATQASDREANAIVDSLLQRIEQHDGILIAATNRADDIDPAIWRRFGMQLEIPLPGEDERFAIIKLYLDPFEMSDQEIEIITTLTEGAAPSLLKQLIEGLKRDLILSERLNLDGNITSVFKRTIASVAPHKAYALPPLWDDPNTVDYLKDVKWPPERKQL